MLILMKETQYEREALVELSLDDSLVPLFRWHAFSCLSFELLLPGREVHIPKKQGLCLSNCLCEIFGLKLS